MCLYSGEFNETNYFEGFKCWILACSVLVSALCYELLLVWRNLCFYNYGFIIYSLFLIYLNFDTRLWFDFFSFQFNSSLFLLTLHVYFNQFNSISMRLIIRLIMNLSRIRQYSTIFLGRIYSILPIESASCLLSSTNVSSLHCGSQDLLDWQPQVQ